MGPYNDRHRRLFADPRTRPSNELIDPLVEHTRWRVEQVGRFIDALEAERGSPVVAEAWKVLHPSSRRVGSGDPDE